MIAIILLSVAACVTYGILHDQVTARICVEYFTIGHAPVFGTENPTLLALGWGVIATWWVGVLVGVPLAIVSRAGNLPKLTARDLVRPIGVLMASTALLATLSGIRGYFLALNGQIRLFGRIAERVPPEKHVAFLTDLWMHNASYAGGFIGGVILMGWVWRQRLLAARKSTPAPIG